MTIYDVISRLRRHPLMLEEVSMTAALGLPYLIYDTRFGKPYLYARFLVHKEYLQEGRWFIQSPTQLLEVCCETGRIKRYEVFHGFVPGHELYIFDAKNYVRSSAEPLQKLYQACDGVLQQFEAESRDAGSRHRFFSEREEDAPCLQDMVKAYQKLFRETVTELGQEALYGTMYDAEA